MSTNNAVKGKLEGIAPTADNRDIQRVFEKPAKGIVASVAATVAQAETIMGFARRPCRLSAARIIGDLDVASDATSYATYTVFKRTVTTPGTAVTMLTISTTTAGLGAIVSWASKTLMGGLTTTAANAELDTGDVITFTVAKAAGGKQLGTQLLDLDFEELSD